MSNDATPEIATWPGPIQTWPESLPLPLATIASVAVPGAERLAEPDVLVRRTSPASIRGAAPSPCTRTVPVSSVSEWRALPPSVVVP